MPWGLRFGRYLHVIEKRGAGETAPGLGDPCRAAPLPSGSLNPPGEVRGEPLTPLVPGQGLGASGLGTIRGRLRGSPVPLPAGGLQPSAPPGPRTERGKGASGCKIGVCICGAPRLGMHLEGTTRRRVPATRVLFPGIAGERKRFRDGCFTPSAYHYGAS